jgi:hypothetical protein
MHLLVILLQQLLGLLPNKQQAQPEPVRVRTTPQSGAPEQQAFQSSFGADMLRSDATIFCRSTATRPSRAVLRADGGGGLDRGLSTCAAASVDGTLPVPGSLSAASPICSESPQTFSPESRT